MSVLVGKQAPDFTAQAVVPIAGSNENEIVPFTLSKEIKGGYAVLFFYPMDFTFVCPSELIAFDHRLEEFKKRNVKVISVSIDSVFTHMAWKNTPVDKGGIGQLSYPMVSDIKHEICRAYDVEVEAIGVAYRGSFLIDRAGLVRHQVVNDLPLGRDIDEMLRVVDALQFTEEHGEVCPAGWKKGRPAMKANPQGVASYLAEHSKAL